MANLEEPPRNLNSTGACIKQRLEDEANREFYKMLKLMKPTSVSKEREGWHPYGRFTN